MKLTRDVVGRAPGFDTADLQEAQALLEVWA